LVIPASRNVKWNRESPSVLMKGVDGPVLLASCPPLLQN